ncbi:MAG: hypothetical protein FWH14_04825 [Oscillospiraceae bacterium]|nr:hypothetical protein [Oscillospiraceae bacterium]
MECIRQTIGSNKLDGIISLPSSLRNKKVEIIILPMNNANNLDEEKPKRQLGFAKGAEIPDSFFEPLSEEELQAWGM